MRLPSSDRLSSRQARIRQSLDVLSLQAFIVTSPSNIRYLSNHVGTSGVLVVTADTVYLLVDARYREAVSMLQRTASACPGLVVWDVPESYDEALVACLGETGASSIGFEAAHVTVDRYHSWQATMTRRGVTAELRTTARIVEQARVVKDAAEVAVLREAAERLTPVAAAAFEAVRVGQSERGVAAVIEAALRQAGYERPAFDTIVASGPHAALPHHRAGERMLAAGDLVVLDFGGVLDGYCSDLTRTRSVGAPSAEARQLHAAVLAAQQSAIEAVRSGAETTVVDAAARDVLRDRGLGDAFGHGTGHGLGLDIHEEPRITWPRPDVASVRLESGMVVTIEPGAYVPGFGGVRIEDDILVTDAGCEVLTRVSRELRWA